MTQSSFSSSKLPTIVYLKHHLLQNQSFHSLVHCLEIQSMTFKACYSNTFPSLVSNCTFEAESPGGVRLPVAKYHCHNKLHTQKTKLRALFIQISKSVYKYGLKHSNSSARNVSNQVCEIVCSSAIFE